MRDMRGDQDLSGGILGWDALQWCGRIL